jgi:hypothetical protein
LVCILVAFAAIVAGAWMASNEHKTNWGFLLLLIGAVIALPYMLAFFFMLDNRYERILELIASREKEF